ncbi:FecR family protein [Paraflavitalea speifideaquila]|uniref:FecR family protein n=1 Tax=Paraflavitalea speifideaquila TaxID=3076558 RepID=UPI0028F0CC9A|nr:FecR domain-containing protein [Paraflavitalea speifideiaquila]
MTKEEINYLAEKIASGLATKEEVLLYNQALSYLEKWAADTDLNVIGDKSAIESEIKNSILTRVKRQKPVIQFAWAKWAAVASFLIILGAAFYLLLAPGMKKQNIAANRPKTIPSNSILPGGNKAVLTLADGSRIILDSTENGTITQQDGICVTKLSDGQLSYNVKNRGPGKAEYNTITTPAGGQYQLLLADGSKVWLNAASSIRFPSFFSGNERSVELSGEGYFEIVHNASMPFRVIVNDMKVEVLGTQFNINSYQDERSIKTTLLQGSVKVDRLGRGEILKPKEQLMFDVSTNIMEKKKNVDVDEVVAWKEGRFKFKQMPIESIMRQLARWYNVKVEYKGKIATELYSGDISRQEDVTQLLDVLEATNTVSFKLEGKKIIIYSK